MENLTNSKTIDLKTIKPWKSCSEFITVQWRKLWRYRGIFPSYYFIEKVYVEVPIAMFDHIFIGKSQSSLSGS